MRARYVLGALGVVCLAACGSKNDANEKNFTPVVIEHLKNKGDVCINIWRVNTRGFSEGEFRALESAGLVKEKIEENKKSNKPAGKEKFYITDRDYTFTDEAQPFLKEFRDHGPFGKEIGLCWGKQIFDKIVKWEGPMKFGDYQTATVFYTYKTEIAADWAKKPEIQEKFPYIQKLVDQGSNEDKVNIKLTSIGWEASYPKY